MIPRVSIPFVRSVPSSSTVCYEYDNNGFIVEKTLPYLRSSSVPNRLARLVDANQTPPRFVSQQSDCLETTNAISEECDAVLRLLDEQDMFKQSVVSSQAQQNTTNVVPDSSDK